MERPDQILRATWAALGGTADDDIAASIVARHAEVHRAYHTATHVAWVLHHVDALLAVETTAATGEVDHAAIRAAALFHDIVYDPRSATNEADSADIAVDALRAIGWSDLRTRVVRELIMATAAHEATTPAAAVLLDADLAILGARPDSYAHYVDGVRVEYGFVPGDAWRAGRAAVLQSFLDREHIFATSAMRAAREQQARANLSAELASLTR